MPEYATKTQSTGEYFRLHENASDAVVAAWLRGAAGRNHQSWPKDKIGPFLTSKLGCNKTIWQWIESSQKNHVWFFQLFSEKWQSRFLPLLLAQQGKTPVIRSYRWLSKTTILCLCILGVGYYFVLLLNSGRPHVYLMTSIQSSEWRIFLLFLECALEIEQGQWREINTAG